MREKKAPKTTKTSNKYEKLLQERLKKEKRGSPYHLNNCVLNLTIFFKILKDIAHHYDIGENTVKCMCVLYTHWLNKREGMNLKGLGYEVFGNRSKSNIDHATYEKTRILVYRLMSLGLVEVLSTYEVFGKSVRRFGPTVKMMRELNALFVRFGDEKEIVISDADKVAS